MRGLLRMAGLCVLGAGCGSSTGDPVSACYTLASNGCNALASCHKLNGVTVTQCTKAAETAAHCSTAKCPTGTSFDSSAAATCVDAIRIEDCTDLGSFTPPSCLAFCR